jgi:uncharacterized protein
MGDAAQQSTAALLDGVKRAAESVPLVQTVYVFGSQMTGRARRDSDLDVAVAFVPRSTPDERAEAKLALIDALTRELGPLGERADVLDLERAGSEVGFRAIKTGRCVLARDRARRIAVEVRVARRYDDDAPKRALFRQAAIDAARRMGEEPSRG